MGLLQVATNTVTSAVASVSLTGIDSDDVYVCYVNKLRPSTSGADLQCRVTESGTANSTSNYDQAYKFMPASTSFSNSSSTNLNKWDLTGSIDTSASGNYSASIYYIYNANNSSEYTFLTWENIYTASNGIFGGSVFTSASSVNGLQFFMDTGNISAGTFTFYKVV